MEGTSAEVILCPHLKTTYKGLAAFTGWSRTETNEIDELTVHLGFDWP